MTINIYYKNFENRFNIFKNNMIYAFTVGYLLLFDTNKYIEMKTYKIDREIQEIKKDNKLYLNKIL